MNDVLYHLTTDRGQGHRTIVWRLALVTLLEYWWDVCWLPVLWRLTLVNGCLEDPGKCWCDRMGHLFKEFGGYLVRTCCLFGFKPCRSFSTPFSVTLMSGAVGVVLVPRFWMSDVSSMVNTDENCWFKREALVCGSPCRFPSDCRGAIPALSHFLLLMKEKSFFLLESSCTMSDTYVL